MKRFKNWNRGKPVAQRRVKKSGGTPKSRYSRKGTFFKQILFALKGHLYFQSEFVFGLRKLVEAFANSHSFHGAPEQGNQSL
jgi:hypothetical protein